MARSQNGAGRCIVGPDEETLYNTRRILYNIYKRILGVMQRNEMVKNVSICIAQKPTNLV
ncbi:MAG TPA: hypothetical protein DCP52_03235 [Elusimicrobia bacterium]|nr:hypothetical protein [Elusimicrobiota bacterium]